MFWIAKNEKWRFLDVFAFELRVDIAGVASSILATPTISHCNYSDLTSHPGFLWIVTGD